MAKSLSKLKDHAAAAMARSSNLGGGGGGAIRCKKHPKHKQSPGVCSLCLREKLSHLVNTGSSASRIASATMGSCSSSSLSSLSSYYSSSSASSCSSPYFRPHTARKGSISMSLLFKRRRSSNFLTTSRSLTSSRFTDKDDGDRKKNKADGFWSKLMVNRRGKEIVEEALRRSTSTRDHQRIAS